MHAKQALALVASATLAEHALASNVHHRHMHRHILDRAVNIVETDVVVVTDYVTVYVTDGEPANTVFFAASSPHRSEGYASLSASTSTSSSSTSTSTSSTTTSSTSAPAPVIVTPSAAPTTFATVSKPAETPVTSAAAVPANVNAQQSTPASATVAAAPAPAAASGGKKGFAYNNADYVNTFFTGGNSCTHCVWAYNWDSSDYGNLRDGVEFVPMLWAPIPDHTNNWVSNANAMISKGASNLLGFNEPDNAGQANLSPGDAAAGHVQWMNPFSGKARIGAPAITNSNIAGQGLDWLKQFVSACKGLGCAIDFYPTHWYADVSAAQSLFDHLEGVYQAAGGGDAKVWLTEFAPFGSDAEIADFLTTNLPKLEALPYLERFSYFMVNTGSLLSSTNSLSSYGQVYASS